MPRAGFASREAGIRAHAHPLQRPGEAAGGLLPQEQGPHPAHQVRAGTPGHGTSGAERDGPSRRHQDQGHGELPELPSTARIGAARPADQGRSQQHAVLPQLPQEPVGVAMRGHGEVTMRLWGKGRTRIALVLAALTLVLAFFPAPAMAKKKKKEEPAKTEAPPKPQIDTSKLVWPEPPNIARVKYMDYFAGEKLD